MQRGSSSKKWNSRFAQSLSFFASPGQASSFGGGVRLDLAMLNNFLGLFLIERGEFTARVVLHS